MTTVAAVGRVRSELRKDRPRLSVTLRGAKNRNPMFVPAIGTTLAAVFLIAGCSRAPATPSSAATAAASPRADASAPAAALPDGIYRVVRSQSEEPVPEASNPRFRVLRDSVWDTDDAGTRWVVLDPSSSVPLILEAPPLAEEDAGYLPLLRVTLARRYVRALEDFTRANLDGRAAVVLDGAIVTIHKVRAVVTGGVLQITRCSDHACDVLRSRLLEDVDAG
jgi:hypothetical protein